MVRKFGTPVELPGDPADDLHAAPKQYVDTVAAGKADATHAAEHATAGSDPVSPASIGAATTGHDHDGAYQPLDSDLTTIAGLTATTDSVLQAKSSAWTTRTPAQLKTDLALVKGDVGLGNVDNTSDADKPVSTATQAALDAKVPTGPAYVGTLFSNQTLGTGSWNALSFGSEEIDTHSGHSTVTNNSRYTIPTGWGGLYYVAAGAYVYGGTGGSTRAITIAWNGSNLNYSQYNGPGNDAVTISTIPVLLSLSAGDYVEAKVYQNSGSNRTALASQTSMMVTWVRSA